MRSIGANKAEASPNSASNLKKIAIPPNTLTAHNLKPNNKSQEASKQRPAALVQPTQVLRNKDENAPSNDTSSSQNGKSISKTLQSQQRPKPPKGPSAKSIKTGSTPKSCNTTAKKLSSKQRADTEKERQANAGSPLPKIRKNPIPKGSRTKRSPLHNEGGSRSTERFPRINNFGKTSNADENTSRKVTNAALVNLVSPEPPCQRHPSNSERIGRIHDFTEVDNILSKTFVSVDPFVSADPVASVDPLVSVNPSLTSQTVARTHHKSPLMPDPQHSDGANLPRKTPEAGGKIRATTTQTQRSGLSYKASDTPVQPSSRRKDDDSQNEKVAKQNISDPSFSRGSSSSSSVGVTNGVIHKAQGKSTLVFGRKHPFDDRCSHQQQTSSKTSDELRNDGTSEDNIDGSSSTSHTSEAHQRRQHTTRGKSTTMEKHDVATTGTNASLTHSNSQEDGADKEHIDGGARDFQVCQSCVNSCSLFRTQPSVLYIQTK